MGSIGYRIGVIQGVIAAFPKQPEDFFIDRYELALESIPVTEVWADIRGASPARKAYWNQG